MRITRRVKMEFFTDHKMDYYKLVDENLGEANMSFRNKLRLIWHILRSRFCLLQIETEMVDAG